MTTYDVLSREERMLQVLRNMYTTLIEKAINGELNEKNFREWLHTVIDCRAFIEEQEDRVAQLRKECMSSIK